MKGMKGRMYRADGDLGAGRSRRTGGNISQTGRLLRCIRVRVPVFCRVFGTGKSPGAGGSTGISRVPGACRRVGAVRSLVAGRRPGAKGNSP